MVHVSGCQDLAGNGIYTEELVACVGDHIAAYQDGTAHCVRVNTAADLIRPIQCSFFRDCGNAYIGHCVVGIRATEVGPGRTKSRVNGRIDRCKIQRPNNFCRSAISTLLDGIAFLTVNYDKGIAAVVGHGQGAVASNITVLGQGVGIAVTLAQLIGSIRLGPQPFAGHDLINGQLGIRRCGNEGSLHGRCLLDVDHISRASTGGLLIFNDDGNSLGLDGAIQVNGSYPCFGHIRTVHKDTIAYGFFAVAEIVFIAGQAQFHFFSGHGNRHGILIHIGNKAGGTVVLGQNHSGSIALCGHVLHRQCPLEGNHIILIVGNTVFFLSQPNS